MQRKRKKSSLTIKLLLGVSSHMPSLFAKVLKNKILFIECLVNNVEKEENTIRIQVIQSGHVGRFQWVLLEVIVTASNQHKVPNLILTLLQFKLSEIQSFLKIKEK